MLFVEEAGHGVGPAEGAVEQDVERGAGHETMERDDFLSVVEGTGAAPEAPEA